MQYLKNRLNSYNPYLSGLGIRNLDIFLNHHFENTLFLYLYSTRLNDISGIRAFKNLRSLVIRGSDLTSFEVLAELPHLTYLDISYSRATTLESLKGCVNLRTLVLDKESNLSLEPIQDLITVYSGNPPRPYTRMKVEYISGRLKDYPVHPYYKKDVPVLQGDYKLVKYYSETESELRLLLEESDKLSGQLTFKEDGTYLWTIGEPLGDSVGFVRAGTYRTEYNLIYLTDTATGASWYSGFFWEWWSGSLEISERLENENDIYRRYSFKRR